MSTTTGINKLINEAFSSNFANVGTALYPIQKTVIQSVLEGKNTLALMPTGSGKSLCYWVAGKALQCVTLVVFPLTALMDEQAQKLRKQGCSVFVLHSGINTRDNLTSWWIYTTRTALLILFSFRLNEWRPMALWNLFSNIFVIR